MKTKLIIVVLAIATTLLSYTTFSKNKNKWHNGTVWRMAFVKVKQGMESKYSTALEQGWKKERMALQNAGLIQSYKVMQSEPHSVDDWNLMLMTEFKSLTAIETEQSKRDSVIKLVDNTLTKSFRNTNFDSIRTDVGYRIVREIVLQ